MTVIKDRRWRSPLWGLALAAVGVAGAPIVVSCTDSNEATVWTTSDLYAYDYYYPADVAYYGTYWVDGWYADPFYYAPIRQAQTQADGGTTADGGTSAQGLTGVGAALRALARGENVCPGQTTVATRTTDLCSFTGGPGTVRTGANIDFKGCTLAGGGRIDGMVLYASTPTASDDNCDANTTITVNYTATYTNLTYTAPSGARLVIPSQEDKGSYTRKATAGPTALSITTKGSLQRFDASNALVANHSYEGARNYTIARENEVLTYRATGTLTVQDVAGGDPVTATGTNITRTAACCRPIGGTLLLSRGDSDATWLFGPACGQATVNGSPTTLPACE